MSVRRFAVLSIGAVANGLAKVNQAAHGRDMIEGAHSNEQGEQLRR